jgi:RNA polymerase sigma-70 factor (ECF subfamily)
MVQTQVKSEDWTEAELIRQAVGKNETAIRAIIQKHNRRLYRVARSIMRDDAEAEDVLQEAYLHAFAGLAGFRGDARLSTWLTRIVANEALQRLRRRPPRADAPMDEGQHIGARVISFPGSAPASIDPERTMAQREFCRLVEGEIDRLPQEFRTVLVARVLEGMSVEDTAAALDIRPETVKTRLHRARRLLKAALSEHLDMVFSDVFPFDGVRCERVASAVVSRLLASK